MESTTIDLNARTDITPNITYYCFKKVIPHIKYDLKKNLEHTLQDFLDFK